MRYPSGTGSDREKDDERLVTIPLTTLTEMQHVRTQIAGHLNALADGKGTSVGPFRISFSVRFHHVHDAYGRQERTRHIVYRSETGEPSGERSLLRHMTSLLETYCDQIRRCPHCKNMFLQFRRHQEYCGRRCQSVAVMQKRRADMKAERKPSEKKRVVKRAVKGGSQHGKKRR
jgi:hypothetical protein